MKKSMTPAIRVGSDVLVSYKKTNGSVRKIKGDVKKIGNDATGPFLLVDNLKLLISRIDQIGTISDCPRLLNPVDGEDNAILYV